MNGDVLNEVSLEIKRQSLQKNSLVDIFHLFLDSSPVIDSLNLSM